LEVLARSDPTALAASIRTAIRTVDPNLPVLAVRPLTKIVDDNLLRERLLARLASVFAGLALTLACLGVYGVLSYTIARRTPEIGVRLALGAEPKSVGWMVLREALFVVAIGLVAGVPAAIALIQLVQKLLYGLSPADPASLTLSVAGLFLAGAAAALVPAWRASRVDPMVALRYE
jgi:ABC-type antimicrobial peptide transport system permease subunit